MQSAFSVTFKIKFESFMSFFLLLLHEVTLEDSTLSVCNAVYNRAAVKNVMLSFVLEEPDLVS